MSSAERSSLFEPLVVVQGGAGDITNDRIPGKLKLCKIATRAGYKVLKDGGSIVDAVEASIRIMEDDENFNAASHDNFDVKKAMSVIKRAVKTGYQIVGDNKSPQEAVEAAINILEDSPCFNAGYGSVLNLDGEVEMDASIMIGSTLNAGAVSVVKDVKNPITLARRIMEKTPHVILSGAGASKFAREQGLEIVPSESLVSEAARAGLENFKKSGRLFTEVGQKGATAEVDTVGCVVMDGRGNLCAGTSTGGISGKMVGRVSDTSQIGSGSYADNDFGAVSTTGHGETIAKFVLAHSIVREIENGKSAQEATEHSIQRMTARLNNTAGAITISKDGDIGIAFSSKRMAWAYQRGDELHFGIEHGEDQMEKIK